ncbi:AI-2E family transporter [Streptomyces sp. 5-10]|uniref:AI-2E family transporter n=1 Tax=Streptomyces sp. 5-10 TaxID=878925 RepID=UPI00168B5BE0|nr:AI-2E family transporter [Streptomyces sp. 5-10]MBD3011100.1 AI-2E family transporter [Streptomyces sp. 5-10]
MSKLPQWVGRLGTGLTRLAHRLESQQAEMRGREGDGDTGPRTPPGPERGSERGSEPRPEPSEERPRGGAESAAGAEGRNGPESPESPETPQSQESPETPGGAAGEGEAARPERPASVPAPPAYAPAVSARPDPVAALPWGVRVAAEAAWRLLVLGATVWVLMRVISSVQLVVLSFTVAILITALLEPTVTRLRRRGVPRGLATALTFIAGFVVMGLVVWFVVWQVMENVDEVSGEVQAGIDDLRRWLLHSPFHVTEKQINHVAKSLREAVGANTEQITSAGLEGVTVVVEVLTGILLTMFSTLFLLYDGPKIWNWTLKLVPARAREGVAGAGPRAWATLTAYVRGTVIVALIDAIFIGVGLFFLDVPMAVPLAVFIFLFAFIPLVGAVVSGALAVVVALVTQGVFTGAMVLIVVLAVQQIEGHVLQPFILGRAVRVHPLAVVLSVAAGSLIGGIGGAVVAVPLVAVANTVVVYLRGYSQENALRAVPGPHGATASGTAPTARPGLPPGEGGAR